MMSLYFFLVSFILLFFVKQSSEQKQVKKQEETQATKSTIKTYSFTCKKLPPPINLEEYRRSELRKAYRIWIENCNQINQLKRSV